MQCSWSLLQLHHLIPKKAQNLWRESNWRILWRRSHTLGLTIALFIMFKSAQDRENPSPASTSGSDATPVSAKAGPTLVELIIWPYFEKNIYLIGPLTSSAQAMDIAPMVNEALPLVPSKSSLLSFRAWPQMPMCQDKARLAEIRKPNDADANSEAIWEKSIWIGNIWTRLIILTIEDVPSTTNNIWQTWLSYNSTKLLTYDLLACGFECCE